MANTIRIGIIGTGGIATAAHIPGYRALEDVEIAALCDVVPGRAAQVATDIPGARAYVDYREMLAKEELDAVSVTTPNSAHREATVAAFEAGLHVLCEKPIAMSLAEGQEMAEAARKAGKLLQIGVHMRFEAEAMALRRIVEAGDMGRIYHGEATYMRRRGIPTWGVFTQSKFQGGGALIDIGVHALDRALWLMGNPKPVAVMGMTYANFGKRRDLATPRGLWDVDKFDVDDMGVALIRFEDGASLILRACWAAHIEGNIIGTRILGTEGGAHMSPLCIYRDMHGSMVDVSPTGLVPVDGHTAEIAHFVQCIRGKAECMVPVEQVLDVQAILDAIYLSSSTGREVRLDA
ncbi:MAG: Gfo/Idh/MocA family oxidoreductase [Chloroflexi bacterium]|mgnify:CR=1 FL=1|nr:Gfo/Idh/MocA family oxidoreductase [Chloroflexota bacterium]